MDEWTTIVRDESSWSCTQSDSVRLKERLYDVNKCPSRNTGLFVAHPRKLLV
jgi:hypothetical protein